MKSTLLTCIQCDDVFEFSDSEQEKFDRLGFDAPQRCPKCRKNKFKASDAPEGKRFKDKRKPNRSRNYEYEDNLY